MPASPPVPRHTRYRHGARERNAPSFQPVWEQKQCIPLLPYPEDFKLFITAPASHFYTPVDYLLKTGRRYIPSTHTSDEADHPGHFIQPVEGRLNFRANRSPRTTDGESPVQHNQNLGIFNRLAYFFK